MQVYDLTHLIHRQMPVYPGDSHPVFRQLADPVKDGFREVRMELNGHTGTHIDSPAHMLPDGKTLDEYPVTHFTGKAAIINIPPGIRMIGIPMLMNHEKKIAESDYVLLVTGWSRFWGDNAYYRDYPVLTVDAANRLVSFPLKGIGVDTMSVDPPESEDWPVHHVLFDAGLVIVENLYFPPGFNSDTIMFCCLPLHYEFSDGSPARAIAVTDQFFPGH